MKISKYLSLVLLVALSVSCEKHEIEYPATPITNMAEFQLHYFNPVTAVASNNITTVLVNGQLYSNTKAPLSTYNAIPSGTVGVFYSVTPGTVNLKLYQGTTGETLVYDQNVTLTAGKQNVFVHDFNLPPVVFDNGHPYSTNVTENTDSVAWVRFNNFLYETAGVTNNLRLQYQYIDPAGQLVNIGDPILFGETTGWQPVKVIKTVFNSSGSRIITFRIKVIDGSGAVVGDLQVRNASGVMVNYTATATLFIGRRYHHTLGGFRSAVPISSVRVFTAL
jgi:hypothetical protein